MAGRRRTFVPKRASGRDVMRLPGEFATQKAYLRAHPDRPSIREAWSRAGAGRGPEITTGGGDTTMTETAIEVVDPKAWLSEIFDGLGAAEVDPEEARAAIITRILNAQTLGEAFSPTGTTGTKDLVGRSFEFRAIRPAESTIEGGGDMFLLADVVSLEDGEVLTINTSSDKIMARLIWAHMHSAFPIQARIVKSGKPSKKGYFPLDLELVE